MKPLQQHDVLPQSIRDLIERIGEDAAEIIVQRRGGVTLCVPRRVSDDHWLMEAIGRTAFEQLVYHYQGEELWIANCTAAFAHIRKQRIIEQIGDPTVDLARRHGVSDRYIRMIKAEHRDSQPDNQIDLFDQE